MSLSNDLYLTPKAGVTVRDPKTGKPLAESGESKPATSYWLRRLRDGDVIQGKPPKAASAASTAAKGDSK
ncbi:DUF2635 domain-containing protein [Dyella lutea]|uniref:DUF2635 domain-containing protein n=1 Tax=Dyella lutea TaxID=2950441 RepID=A0ABT1FDD5_9GAMM|nr:DUF2635 domain-containing protein [Dyella lutea]